MGDHLKYGRFIWHGSLWNYVGSGSCIASLDQKQLSSTIHTCVLIPIFIEAFYTNKNYRTSRRISLWNSETWLQLTHQLVGLTPTGVGEESRMPTYLETNVCSIYLVLRVRDNTPEFWAQSFNEKAWQCCYQDPRMERLASCVNCDKCCDKHEDHWHTNSWWRVEPNCNKLVLQIICIPPKWKPPSYYQRPPSLRCSQQTAKYLSRYKETNNS